MSPCPECLQGKHDNCDGTTWDVVRDEPGPCPCSAVRHIVAVLPEGESR